MAAKKEKDPTLRSERMAAIVDSLSRKFEDDKILQRKVEGGKSVNYVKAQEYIVKLNETFGVAWSFEICSHWLVNNNIVMWVRITYPNPDNPDQLFFKDGIAGHPLSGNVGNAFKSVYSKAFTKAAAQIGAGLHLWGVDSEEDEAPNWDNYNAGGPPVHVVNPGAHNPLPPVPGGAPAVPTGLPAPPAPPQQQGYGQPPNGQLPPPPLPQGQVPQGQVPNGYGAPPGPTPPEFYNSGANTGQAPPAPPAPPGALPPVPTGNPNPNAATGMGYSEPLPDGSRGPATAAVGIQSGGAGTARIADFQINGIMGAAVSRGLAHDPMQLVISVLGEGFRGMTIEQLTQQQAQEVMDAVRQMPPQ